VEKNEGLHPYIRWTKTPDFVHVYCGISPMSRVFLSVSHLLHMTFVLGLCGSLCHPCFVNPAM
jgi:hypothetical protein